MNKLKSPLSKLQCLSLKMMLPKRVTDIENRKRYIEEACKELKESQKLKLIMESILMIGNVLNNQNEDIKRVEMVKSFTLASLSGLSSTKGFDKKTSLLDFLERVLAAKIPEVFDVYEELPNLIPASRETLDGIKSDRDSLANQLGIVTTELKNTKNSLDNDSLTNEERSDLEQSIQEMKEFTSNAQSVIDKLKNDIENTKTCYSNTVAYFGQDDSLSTDEFFNYFIGFIESLLVVHRKMEEMRERANNKLKKQKEMEMKQKNKMKQQVSGKNVDLSKEVVSKESDKSDTEDPERNPKPLVDSPSIPSSSFENSEELLSIFNKFHTGDKQNS